MLIINTIIGKFIDYTEVKAQDGYCFYDVDEPIEERYYTTSIVTPTLDRKEIERRYIEVKGDADELNEALHNEIDINA